MEFISENIIEATVANIGASEANFNSAFNELRDQQSIVAAYIFSENFDLFTNAEREYFLFLVLVLFKSIQRKTSELPNISAEMLGKKEEQNWELINNVTAKKFRERLDIFFKDYFQEDLLAFIEDSLTEEEEELVTKIGREPMFIALKSIIDSWCDSPV